MPNYSAQDVKRLREETDAPMMECKGALDEADGNYERAKEILREKGKAAAVKRAGRSTSEGVVAVSLSRDSKTIGGVVVECETDFVARNDDFIAVAQEIADIVRDAPGAVEDNARIKEIIEGSVAKIRENIKVSKAVRFTTEGHFVAYVHHDRTKGSIVEYAGAANDDAVKKVAIQIVAFPPQVLNKEELSKEVLDREIEAETKRAVEEGKPQNIAENIAKGRVNKEFVSQVVLKEQPFYLDPKKTVAQYLSESAKGSVVAKFEYLAVGQAS